MGIETLLQHITVPDHRADSPLHDPIGFVLTCFVCRLLLGWAKTGAGEGKGRGGGGGVANSVLQIVEAAGRGRPQFYFARDVRSAAEGRWRGS